MSKTRQIPIERLARYLIRPPVSLQRLHYLPETNQVLYQAKPGHDGGSSENIDPMEFVARVLTHIPDPNRHTIDYFGRYSNRAKPTSRRIFWYAPIAVLQCVSTPEKRISSGSNK